MSNSDQSHKQHADGIVEAGQKAPVYFYVLFFGLIAWGVIFIGYYLISGWSSHSEFDEKMAEHSATYNQSAPPAAAATPAPAADTTNSNEPVDAAALFASYCAGCHGEDGSGGFGSDLTKATYKYGKDPESVKVSIADGRDGRMPGFGEQLSQTEISALADHVLKL